MCTQPRIIIEPGGVDRLALRAKPSNPIERRKLIRLTTRTLAQISNRQNLLNLAAVRTLRRLTRPTPAVLGDIHHMVQLRTRKLRTILDPRKRADLTIRRSKAKLWETHDPTPHDGQPVACARGRATGCPQRAHCVLVIDDTTGLQYRSVIPFMGYHPHGNPSVGCANTRRVSVHARISPTGVPSWLCQPTGL